MQREDCKVGQFVYETGRDGYYKVLEITEILEYNVRANLLYVHLGRGMKKSLLKIGSMYQPVYRHLEPYWLQRGDIGSVRQGTSGVVDTIINIPDDGGENRPYVRYMNVATQQAELEPLQVYIRNFNFIFING